MSSRINPQIYDGQGRPIFLDGELRRGGEGAVYDVKGRGNLVAKLYHKPVDGQKAAKLATMVGLRTERLLKLTAWPVETLHERPGGTLKGFLMPKVVNHKEVHVLYGVKSRLSEYPQARWPFLIQTAANVARAFSVVHEHGQVIGDVNHGGIFVSDQATVVLVDCDSFQVVSQGRQFLCEVGIDTHTPPELQGRPFHGVVRTPNHDAFGLAVIVFQLLFMGRHPFSGQYLGAGDMPIDRAIRELRFAYGASAGARQMRQPPGTVPLEAASQPVARMFERAFLEQARPKPHEWVTALSDLALNLQKCARNSGHHYLKTLAACPWCEAEASLGVVLFNVVFTSTGVPGTFNVTAVWAQITSLRPPDPLPTLPDRASLDLSPSPRLVGLSRAQTLRAWISTGAVVLATVFVLLTVDTGVVAFFILLLVGIGATIFNLARGNSGKVQEDARKAKAEAERRWRDLEQRWRAQADDGRFGAKLHDLEGKKRDYQNLAAVRQRKLRQLEAEQWERQRERFLDTFRISDAKISGIGPSRKTTLYSFGIETAADVTDRALSGVPGFGPTYTAKLLTWRRVIEQRFVFDPKQGVNPADTQAVEQEIATARSRLEQQLQNGAAELGQISQNVRATRDALRSAAEQAAKALAQAEVDWRALPKVAATAPVYAAVAVALLFAVPLRYGAGGGNLGAGSLTTRPLSTSTPSASPSANVNAGPSLAEQPAAQAQTLYNQGLKLTKANKYAEAARLYQQAVALKPDMAEAHHELGYALFRLGKYQESVAACKQALSLKPNDADTYRNLGQNYEALGNWREARDAFQSAVNLAPNDPASYYNLGLILRRLNDDAAATGAYNKAVRLKPGYADAHYELGMLYLAAGDLDKAVNECTTLRPLNSKLAEKLETAITGQDTEHGTDNSNEAGQDGPAL